MRNLFVLGAAFFLASALPRTPAQVPPAEQFLPDDLTAMATIPNWPKFSGFQASSSWGRLWSDPAMKAFREKFGTRFKESVTDPLERELGIKFADYAELLQGQLTFALTPPPEGSGDTFGLLAVLDAKDKADVLTTRLADARKRWTEAGREIRTEKLRETEFAVVTLAQKDVAALLARIIPGANPDAAAQEEGKGKAVYLGQVKSLLIVGENPKTIEKILARLSGTDVPNLADLGDFQKGRTAVFRDTLAAGWLRFAPLFAKVMERAPGAASPLPTDAILAASGLTSLKSIAVNLSGNVPADAGSRAHRALQGARLGKERCHTAALRSRGRLRIYAGSHPPRPGLGCDRIDRGQDRSKHGGPPANPHQHGRNGGQGEEPRLQLSEEFRRKPGR
jgi:hypothetical protein